jgi:hypothetical protein
MKARDRIKLFCIARSISQRKLGMMARLIKQEVGHVGSGRYKSGAAVERLAEAMGVSEEWLVHGRGKAPPWSRPLVADDRLPVGKVNADIVARLIEQVAQLRADVAWLKAGVVQRSRQART